MFLDADTKYLTLPQTEINPHLSFEQPVELSGANPHETRKLGPLPQTKVPKLFGGIKTAAQRTRRGGRGTRLRVEAYACGGGDVSP